jgi:hypothetical protein
VGPAAHARRRALRPPPARAVRTRTREHSLRLTCSVSAASTALAASPLAPGCACGTTAPLRGPSVRLLHVACCRVRAVRGVVLGCVLECCALHLCVLLWRCKQEWAAYNDQKVLDYQSIGRPSDANRTPIGRQVAAGCNTHTATCNTHTATCSTHTATCTLQHAARILRHATRTMQHAAHNRRQAARTREPHAAQTRPAQEGPHRIPPQRVVVNASHRLCCRYCVGCEAIACKHRCLQQGKACAAGPCVRE